MLRIIEFVDFKNLLITHLIKRCTSIELKDHFKDSWANYKDPFVLANFLDEYEAIKGPSERPRKVKDLFDWNSEKTKIEEKSHEEKIWTIKPIVVGETRIRRKREKFREKNS